VVAIGLVAAPGLADLGERLAADLGERLKELYPEVAWRVPVVTDGLVTPPAPTTDLIDACQSASSARTGRWLSASPICRCRLAGGRLPGTPAPPIGSR